MKVQFCHVSKPPRWAEEKDTDNNNKHKNSSKNELQ